MSQNFLKHFTIMAIKEQLCLPFLQSVLQPQKNSFFLPLFQLKSLIMWLSFLLKFNILWFCLILHMLCYWPLIILLAEDIIRSSIIF